MLVEVKKWWKSCWKDIYQFLIKLNIHLPYDAVILFLGIYPSEMNKYNHKKIWSRMFIAA